MDRNADTPDEFNGANEYCARASGPRAFVGNWLLDVTGIECVGGEWPRRAMDHRRHCNRRSSNRANGRMLRVASALLRGNSHSREQDGEFL